MRLWAQTPCSGRRLSNQSLRDNELSNQIKRLFLLSTLVSLHKGTQEGTCQEENNVILKHRETFCLTHSFKMTDPGAADVGEVRNKRATITFEVDERQRNEN